jgi:nitrate reductase NapE component
MMDFERASKTVVSFSIIAFVINTLITLGIIGGVGFVVYHFVHKLW